MRPAIFLDRDGTLVYPRHYPSRPEDLCLYSGIADELRLLQSHGLLLIVITNQAGIARGYFSEQDLSRMHDHLLQVLAQDGVYLDAIYYCPHHPEGVIPDLAIRCECRKPQPGMVLRAAREHAIDLEHSWFVGDILDDIEAGNRARCRTVLVDLGSEIPPEDTIRQPTYIARDTLHALQIIAAVEGIAVPVELDYLPSSWHPTHSVEPGVSGDR